MKKISLPKARFNSRHLCRHCNGNGNKECPRCGATGTMNDGSKCYFCQGNRYVTCPACNGTKYIDD